MKILASLALSLFLTAGTAFADSPKHSPKVVTRDAAVAPKAGQPAKPGAAKTNAEITAEVEELRQELQLLKEELAKRDQQIKEALESAASASARASEATMKAFEATTTPAEVKSTATARNSTVSSLVASNAVVVNAPAASNPQTQPANDEKGPTTIRFKGISLTPGGFVGFDTVNRQHAQSADVGTPFNWVPFDGNSTGHLTEMNFSARQSRLCLLFGAKAGSTTLSGYYEADFLGSGTTSNNRQTNPYIFRQRQLWGQVALENGLSFSGGQMWSLATEDKKGIALRQESLPMMIDPNYVVGFTWQRAGAFRVTKVFNENVAVAVAVEGPQTTIGGRGFSTYTNPSATGSVTTYQNFFLNAPGVSGGFFNAFDPTGYTVNKLSDFLVKVAIDPGFGHYELFGIFSDFRNRVYPCAVAGTTAKNFPAPATPTVISCNGSTTPSAALAYNNSSFGGGLGVSATEYLLSKKLDVGLKVVAGDGIGRYGSAQLPDVTARPTALSH